MTRRGDRYDPGLEALWAAVAQARNEERARGARAGLTARDLSEPGRPRPARVSGRGGRLRSADVPSPRPDAGDTGPVQGPHYEVSVLVERAQNGDWQAYEQLYQRYFLTVYRYVYYRVGNPQQAEDLTSETFERALRRFKSFRWQGLDIAAWFLTIARNLITDHYRSARYRLEVVTDDVTMTGRAPHVEGPESAVLAGLESAAVLTAVRQLTPEQQECVALRFLHGLSVAETAAVMGKKEPGIRALQYRATRRLAALLPDRSEL